LNPCAPEAHMNPVLIADIKKPATFVTGFVARMGLEPMASGL
jgi:hypothetical protein